ncbi:hypothetical protein C9I89_22150, partial [Photobacterium lipolyticum]
TIYGHLPACKASGSIKGTGWLPYIRPVYEIIISGLDETFAHIVLITTTAFFAMVKFRFSICRSYLFFILPIAIAIFGECLLHPRSMFI